MHHAKKRLSNNCNNEKGKHENKEKNIEANEKRFVMSLANVKYSKCFIKYLLFNCMARERGRGVMVVLCKPH